MVCLGRPFTSIFQRLSSTNFTWSILEYLDPHTALELHDSPILSKSYTQKMNEINTWFADLEDEKSVFAADIVHHSAWIF